MNTPDPMPSNFGLKYIFWMACRWVYFNPLTILLTLQDIAIQLVVDYPAWRWLGTASGILGIVIAQMRNVSKDYTIPVAQSKHNQAKAVLAANPINPPILQPEIPK